MKTKSELKKNVPLAILGFLEEIAKTNNSFIPIETKGNLISFAEKDHPNSPFYFTIKESFQYDLSPAEYRIVYLPCSADHLNSSGYLNHNLSSFKHAFLNWLKLIKFYNDTDSIIFDDPIIKRYYDDLAPEFQNIDDDAELAPFSYKQQDLLLGIYEKTKLLVKSKKTNDNSDYAKAIIDSIESAEKTIHVETKSQVMKRLRTVAAMCMKYSREVGKAIITELLVEVSKRLLLGI